jgi:hypothetical protein
VSRNLSYFISLPERFLRASAVLLGGMIFEITQALLPDWLRRTRLFQAIVAGILRILIEFVGGGTGLMPQDDISAQQLAVRKAAGTGIELVSLLTIGWSPLWIFAVAADLTGGARSYLKTLELELKRVGILPEYAEINSTQELLNIFEDTSDIVAETLDIPPLTLHEMRDSWKMLNSNVKLLPEPDRLSRIYDELKGVADHQDCTLGDLSTLMAASAYRAGAQMGQVHIFDFYKTAIKEIEQEGFKTYSLRVTRPYAAAAKSHFDIKRSTYTQRFLFRKVSH